MHSPENVVPLRVALEVIGIKSKSPASFRRYWLPLGAPIIPAVFAETRERWGTDPEALRAFIIDHRSKVALSAPELPKKAPGFAHTMDEVAEMVAHGEKCALCGAEIEDVTTGWHALRGLQHPAEWVGMGRPMSDVALLCGSCLPVFDAARRDSFALMGSLIRAERTEKVRRVKSLKGDDRRHRVSEIRSAPFPDDDQVTREAYNLSFFHKGLASMRRDSGLMVSARGYCRADGRRITLDEVAALYPTGAEESRGESQPDLRLERGRGRPAAFTAKLGCPSRGPHVVRYDYDGGATW